MTQSRNAESKWREVLEKQLGTKWRPHYKNIAFQIGALNRGIKQGLLWDIGPPLSRDRFLGLVEQLRSNELLAPSINIVYIENDHLLVNLGGLIDKLVVKTKDGQCEILNLPNELAYQFLDVSKNSDSISVISKHSVIFDTKIKHLITTLSQQCVKYLNDLNLNYLELKFEPDICIPAIFGILIGYPVVYWYDEAAIFDRVNVRVYKLFLKTFELYSFSVTKEELAKTHRFVKSWMDELKKKYVTADDEFVFDFNDILLNQLIL